MKPTLVTMDEVAGIDTLSWAFWRAARRRRDRPEVRAFESDLDRELARLGDELRAGTVALGSFTRFVIRDPKRRVIHAPVFRDRVIHHALMRPIEPVFERALVDGCYACRRGRGVLAAVRRTQANLRRFPWLVKVDVAAYFDSIDHATLLEQLRRRVRGRRVFELLVRVLSSYEVRCGRGLPIGALTSQHFANLYLTPLDRHLLEEVKVGALVRYMDDLIWWCRTREECRTSLASARAFAQHRLRLSLKPSAQIRRSADGVALCGFRIRRGTLLLSRRRCRRFTRARRRWERAFLEGVIDADGLQRAMASAIAVTLHADATTFRRRVLSRTPGPDA